MLDTMKLRPSRSSFPLMRRVGSLLLATTAGLACATEPEPEPHRIAVMLDARRSGDEPGVDPDRTHSFDWAIETINLAGGVAGRPLAVDYFEPTEDRLVELAQELVADEQYPAVIAPPGSEALQQLADLFIDHHKPLLSTTSTSDELFRAYGGEGVIWRLRDSDVAQAELLTRFARDEGAERIALLASPEISAATFLTWVPFFATEWAYPLDDVEAVALDSEHDCTSHVGNALVSSPDMLLVAAASEAQARCVVEALPEHATRPRVVFADTGIDPSSMLALGPEARGIEGFSVTGDPIFESRFEARFPGARLSPHGPSEYDAILLLAYGLEGSDGAGWRSLVRSMEALSNSGEPRVGDWDTKGVAATLADLRAGGTPTVRGATGDLTFHPERAMDLTSSTLAHFVIDHDALIYDRRYSTDDPSLLTNTSVLSDTSELPSPADDPGQPPEADQTDTWAVIAALSSGWHNYRHQADALRQYQLLRAGGIDDDHIVLVLADDLASHEDNERPGEIRNEIDGEDLYATTKIDYSLSLSPEQLQDIIAGRVTEATPTVIDPGPASNIYIYLVGHAGLSGIPVGAQTAAEGLDPSDLVFSPDLLREGLCELQHDNRFRRALVVIESCFSGVFGEAESGGIEHGCEQTAGQAPLEGVVMLTASNSHELSYAADYDPELSEWVNDEFSRSFARQVELGFDRNLADVFVDTYRSVAGSHPSVFNTAHAGHPGHTGRLSMIPLSEFFAPR